MDKNPNKDEVMVGEEYQCPVPQLLNREKGFETQRRFKLVSSPAALDPKIIKEIESHVCSDLSVTKVSTEKLLLWLRELEYNIPEFFIEVLSNKERAKKRIGWKRERGKMTF